MISLLLVNYRSSALALEAIRTARLATSAPLQVVVVDNSCDAAEPERLRSAADVVIAPETNRGYAGGINAGRPACIGDVIVITNPDVTFGKRSIDRLAEELQRGAAVTGPALYWDSAHEWLLPPSDLHTGWEKLDEMLAARSRAWMLQRDRRRFRQRVAFWSARQPRDVRALSGAVMAVRARDLDELGGFDERFPLYFEETDFLRRVAERRMRIRYVPEAQCRHVYNQSAGPVADEAGARYAYSHARYLEKWNGPLAARFLERMGRPALSHDSVPLAGALTVDHPDAVVVEASPLASFATAAGHFPSSRTVALPDEVLRSFHGEAIYLRVVLKHTGEILATYAHRRS